MLRAIFVVLFVSPYFFASLFLPRATPKRNITCGVPSKCKLSAGQANYSPAFEANFTLVFELSPTWRATKHFRSYRRDIEKISTFFSSESTRTQIMAVSIGVDVNTSDFQHTPLDLTKPSARVFRILPGDGTLHLTLHHVGALANHTAVSYVWGPPEPSTMILVNGLHFNVRDNLYQLLLEMRRRDRRDIFWADAICIDQQNIPERNHQVRQMGSIYKSAKDVFLWLGGGSDETHAFVDWCHLNSLAWDSNFGTFSVLQHQLKQNSMGAKGMMSNQYWERTWIIQEVLLSQSFSHIIIGNKTMSVGLFASFVKYLRLAKRAKAFVLSWDSIDTIDSLIATRSYTFFKDIHHFDGNDDEFDHPLSRLDSLLRQFGQTACTDVRDRIYALSTLLGEDSAKYIEIDYSISPTELAYRLLAKWPPDHPDSAFRHILVSVLELPVESILDILSNELSSESTDRPEFRAIEALLRISHKDLPAAMRLPETTLLADGHTPPIVRQ